MPARRRMSPSPAARRPKVAGTAPAGRPETDGEGPTLTGVRPPRVGAPSRARGRTEPPVAEPPVAEPPAADPPAGEPAATAPAPEDRDTEDRDTATGAAPHAADTDESATDGVADPAIPRGRRRPRGDRAVPTADAPGRGGALLARLRTVPVLAAALVVLVALSAFFGIATASLRGTPAAANTALTDLAATSEVQSQLGDALELLYSYDFARLDENERGARGVITEGFAPEFDRLFAQVRKLAPQQQAVVSAVVTVSAVQSIDGDRAVLVAFMDQQATTAANAEQVAAAGRLTVTGERVDGRWLIAGVESR